MAARTPIAIEWSITGYNVYKRKPHTDVNMYLMTEPDVYDRNSYSHDARHPQNSIWITRFANW